MSTVAVLGSLASSLVNFRGPLLREMVERGHRVIACAPNASYDVRNELSSMDVTYQDVRVERAGRNPWKDMRTIRDMLSLCRQMRPDVVLAYTIKPVIYGSMASRIAGVPRIFSMIEGLGYAFSNRGLRGRLVGGIAHSLYRRALSLNRKVFFLNPDDVEFSVQTQMIRDRSQAVLLDGIGVDLNAFKPAPYPDDVSFLLVARLIRDKGIAEYVQAAQILKKRYPQIRVRLVGGCDENPRSISEPELRSWIASGVIEYVGELSDVRPAIANSSVFVLPSYYREGLPRTLMEAMAMARPLITTDMPGCRETVCDGDNGFLIPPRDVSALAAAMERFISGRYCVEHMGKRSRQIAEVRFDVRKINSVILETMGLE